MDASVGVILRTKNRPVMLKRALDSIIRQTYEDWTVVVVNDGGTREEVEHIICMFSSEIYNKVKVIHNDISLGFASSANLAIQTLKTKFFAIHDDDDTWSPEFLNVAVTSLESFHANHEPIRGVVSLSNIVYERLEGNIITVERIESPNPYSLNKVMDVRAAIQRNPFPSIAFVFYSEIIEEVGLLNPEIHYAELVDWDFHKRILLQYDVAIVPEYLAFQHVRMHVANSYTNHSTTNQADYQLDSEMDYNQKIRIAMREDPYRHFQVKNSLDLSYAIAKMNEISNKNDEIMKFVNFIAVKINNMNN